MSKYRRFLADWAGWIVVGLVLLALVVLFAVLVSTGILQTGFDEYKPSSANAQRAKTLWDWMDLLFVPLALALGAGLFTWVTNRGERQAESDRSREDVLQAYLDRMTELMLKEGLRTSKPCAEVRDIARARTLTVLRQLDRERKGLLMRFLQEADLIKKKEAVVDLSGASLEDSNLRGADLGEARLSSVNLRGADLSGAHLRGANLRLAEMDGADLEAAELEMADLSGAKLKRANLHLSRLMWAQLPEANLPEANLERAGGLTVCLSGANLRGANLRKVSLREANLCEADMSGADLHGANLEEADLSGANLSGANLGGACLDSADLTDAIVTAEQLAKAASLEGAIMPDGTKYTGKLPTQEEAAKVQPAPAGTGADDDEGQPDQPGDLDACGGSDHV